MKKLLIVVSSLLLTTVAQAIPVMNENVANSGVMTIYPDHADPHRYYVAPNVVMIATNKKGTPHFSYAEYRRNLIYKVGVIAMTLVPAYTREELDVAKAEILAKDPLAEFSGLPFIGSSLALNGALPELITSNECNHAAGLIGQEQACSFVLTDKGRIFFLKAIERKMLFTTLQFEYQVQAVLRLADGTFKDATITHGVAVRIDGGQLARHPRLIRRLMY
ncbi:hypothetical protein [Bdellovibrio sp. HCB337]|uniref:hypothetical protein n=1 Tax=Bdellovibrio sp. HCB337 TaxID=3394358 RepID=UPI0039A47060